MRLCLNTDGLGHLSFEEMVETAAQIGIESLEIACGNWSSAPHIDLEEMVASASARDKYMDKIRSKGLVLEALNCSGNQLEPNETGRAHQEVVEKTFCLAEQLGIKSIVMMSGLPGGSPADTTSNWVTTCWPMSCQQILKYQWEEVLIPYWEKTVKLAEEHGITSIALENHGAQCVYNAETLQKLRDAVGPMIGMNLDPSHHMWMGGDGIEMAKALGAEVISHVHAKDLRKERGLFAANGGLETKFFDNYSQRCWNYVALGFGESKEWWKEFFAVLSMMGYDGPISLEIEDKTMPALTAIKKSIDFLHEVMPRDFKDQNA
ncbi:sugar phosphate isomerase/epimerase family protein [Anaerostipes sp.]|uniref:sugar phosphate isomerase/epimerase family protein n=1 Tax=Anaerostipes sp. TaxID=1872530 RepID=UPI0025C2385B|nr:sugar phosphate isomerase/epimerase [Anaerostipes sp.]MBS7008760.1 sugar phosphate isomerase/epimerase [Anaerostipes sp.]